MTDEERAILQGMVNSFYDQFVQVVVRGPPICRRSGSAPWPTAGSTPAWMPRSSAWWTRSATWKTPSTTAKAMACIKDARVVAYDRCDGYRGSIYAGLPKIPSEINVKLDVPGLTGHSGAAFMYLWEPGTLR